ncbi:BnaAnng30940D, partial [Brassica napus]
VDKINQLLKSRLRGADMGATYGFSLGRHSSPFPGQNDDFNYTEVNPDRPTTHTGAPESTQAETGGEHGGDADIGHDPINVEVCPLNYVNPSPSVNVASPDNSDAVNPPSRVDVDQVNVSSERRVDDPVSGVVNKILSEAGIDKNPVRPSTGSGTDVSQTSSDVNPEKVGLDGVHDDRGEAAVGNKGEDVDEDDVTITKVQAGRVNTDAAGGQADGGRRFSRHMHTSTKHYTPPLPAVRKKEGNKKVALTQSLILKKKHTFIGGFSPFTPPIPAAREAFLKTMAEAKSNASSLGSIISIASLDDVFNFTGVCSYEAVDRVVGWIRNRSDSNPSSKFDFIPPTFFKDLIRSYPAFEAMQDKSAFTFPTLDWYDSRFAYVGHLCGGREPDMFCLTSRPRECNYLPFPISRLDIPVLLEHPGYAAVVALILLEIAAVGKPLIDLALTEEEVRNCTTLCSFVFDVIHIVITNDDFLCLTYDVLSPRSNGTVYRIKGSGRVWV